MDIAVTNTDIAVTNMDIAVTNMDIAVTKTSCKTVLRYRNHSQRFIKGQQVYFDLLIITENICFFFFLFGIA